MRRERVGQKNWRGGGGGENKRGGMLMQGKYIKDEEGWGCKRGVKERVGRGGELGGEGEGRRESSGLS